jgi:hypothetical protein
MSFPIILLVGQAGSGKDTAADIVGGQKIALADPMKRLAAAIFGFNEVQLWGPSEARNAPDETWGQDRVQALRDEVLLKVEEGLGHLPESFQGKKTTQHLLGYLLNGDAYNARLNAWLLGVLDHALEVRALTPRYVLQTLGTEFGRSINTNLWINEGIRTAQRLLYGEHVSYDRNHGVVGGKPDERGTEFVVISDGRFRNEVLAVKAAGGHVVKVIRPGATGAVSGGAQGHASEAEQKTIPDTWFDAIIYNDGDLQEFRRAAISTCAALLAPLRIRSSGYRPA